MRRLTAWLTLCALLTGQARLALAQQDDLAAARAANLAARGALNAASAAAVVPGYTNTAPQSALYGQANLAGQARAQLAQCALHPDPAACEAGRHAVASAATPRPALPPSDAQVTGAAAVARNPLASETALAGLYAGCPGPGPCPANTFCLGAQCFDTAQVQDSDFALAMSYLEAAREAGVYLDPARLRVFAGEDNRCRDRLLANCCRSNRAGAGYSNGSLFGVGSHLVFDVLMNANNRSFITAGIKSMLTSYGFSGTFTSYGVTVAVNGVALPAGSVTIAAGESIAVAFTPWSLAITVVFAVVTAMMSCNAEEGQLAMKEGARLCRSVGTWCSQCIRVLGRCVRCIERTTSKCCFNSVLARLVNEQGRAQLGMGWGAPQNPACGGISVAQLQALDFSRFDLSEFYASIAPAQPNVEALKGAAAAKAPQCYARGGKC
ncbi:conjugal transfer protein TraN [Massilia sp. Root351]|uniref:conjugal transfer protein TraN n=1 Tax=Massilia sp. Root351 TaxID=1736522 RepID=UPI0009E83389|nr:conjugal transfer protein TraN [Massilia sp. Root351]